MAHYYDGILEPEQKQLFRELAEAYFSVPREAREPFVAMPLTKDGLLASVRGNGLARNDVLLADLETIRRYTSAFEEHYVRKGLEFSISPQGRQFYEVLMSNGAKQTDHIEEHVWHYFDSPAFEQSYPTTYAKWREASEAVWSSESDRDFATIGFLCRDAMQAFATELIARYGVEGANPDPSATRERFSAVVNQRREAIGERKSDVLDALFNYWREAGKLVQRQVHANERQGGNLVWEDGRRVVFQLGFLMFEAARTLEG